jgi:hypothetical protein
MGWERVAIMRTGRPAQMSTNAEAARELLIDQWVRSSMSLGAKGGEHDGQVCLVD